MKSLWLLEIHIIYVYRKCSIVNKEIYKKIYAEIKKYNTIYLVRHIGPDPDAVASQIALKQSILETFPNKKVYGVGTSVSKFKYIGKLDKVNSFDYDKSLVITLDVPNISRIDGLDILKFKNIIKIDHHPFVESFSGIEYIDEKSCSTCEMLFDLIDNTKLKMTPRIAESLFIGIISDSNRFLFNPCTDRILYKVADLVKRYNLDMQNIYEKIYSRPMSEVRLMGYIASNLKVTKNKFAYIILENDIVSSFNADASSASNMVNEFNNIEDFIVWMFVSKDVKNDVFKINLRSRGPIINEVASKYNGGGHKYSSGARVKTKEELDDLIYDLDSLCYEYLKEQNKNWDSIMYLDFF